jgi:hypothetical protein
MSIAEGSYCGLAFGRLLLCRQIKSAYVVESTDL